VKRRVAGKIHQLFHRLKPPHITQLVDKDLYVDVVGTSPLAALGCWGDLVPGGAATRAAVGKVASYREVLLRQPPHVVFRPLPSRPSGVSMRRLRRS
jgi:hypothetical protein